MNQKTLSTGITRRSAGIVSLTAANTQTRLRPKEMVNEAIAQLEHAKTWKQLVGGAPSVQKLSTNLACYLGDTVPAVNGRHSLLTRCLDNGTRCWKGHDSASTAPRMFTFVRGMLYPLPEALEWSVTRTEGDKVLVWNPINTTVCRWWNGKGTLPEARLRRRPADSAFVEIGPADYRLIVLVRFLATERVPLAPFAGRLDELVSRYG